HETPAVKLHSGWNTVTTRLDTLLVPASDRTNVQAFEWSISSPESKERGYVLFDYLRAARRTEGSAPVSTTLESWEPPLLWRTFDETVRAEIRNTNKTTGGGGFVLHLDFAKCTRPVVFAQLNPPWDLSKVKMLVLEMEPAQALPSDL